MFSLQIWFCLEKQKRKFNWCIQQQITDYLFEVKPFISNIGFALEDQLFYLNNHVLKVPRCNIEQKGKHTIHKMAL